MNQIYQTLIFSTLLLSLLNCLEAQEKYRPPNVLVIMTDDQAQWATSVYGNPEVQTPNLEFLARTGVTFDRAYTISTVCSPSRATFFTGRIPSQHGVHDVLSENPDFDHNWLQDEILLPELMQARGYRTALIGKWHSTTDCLPVQRGWDRWFTYNVHIEGWQNQYVHGGDIHYSDQGQAITRSGYQAQHFSREAIRFLDGQQNDDRPFFLFLGFTETHAPFTGLPERWASQYRNAAFALVPRDESSYLQPRNDYSKIPENHREQLAQYCAGVSLMDDQLGLLLDYLQGKDMLDNTLLIFTSDHGHMNGHHGLYGKGNATTPQNFFEESILVPTLIRWPAGFRQQGTRISSPVNQTDLFRTILSATGQELSPSTGERINSPGQNLLPLLRGEKADYRNFQFAEYGNARMISDGRYKLIVRYQAARPEWEVDFFDLQEDPRETKDLAETQGTHQEKIATMTSRLEGFFDRHDTPRHSARNLSAQPDPNAVPVWKRN